MAAAIARFLPDFSVDTAPARAAAPRTPVQDGLAALLRNPPRPAPPPAEDREALLRAAEARGREQGRAEAQAEAEAALVFAQADAETRLADARQAWCAEEGDRLAATFAGAIQALGSRLTDRVGHVLVPVLTEALRRQAVEELAQSLARILGDPRHPPLRVSGPADLLDAVAGKLGPFEGSVSYQPDESVDVRVQADQTVIETQLGAWGGLMTQAVQARAVEGA